MAVSRFDWQQEARRAARLMAQQAQREAATQYGAGREPGDAGGRLKPSHEGSREERSRLLANGHANGLGNGHANGHGNGQHVSYILDAEAIGAALAVAPAGAASAPAAAAGAMEWCAAVGAEGVEHGGQQGPTANGHGGAATSSGGAQNGRGQG